MIVLDENMDDTHRRTLLKWRIRCRQVGLDIGWAGMSDADIVRLLHRQGRTTFFSFDGHFYRRELCHPRYCFVHLRVAHAEVPSYVRRFLKHPDFSTFARRAGRVVQMWPSGLRYWTTGKRNELRSAWPKTR